MPPEFSVKIGPQELERLIGGRKSLDDCQDLAVMAARYHELGWSPAILAADTRTEVAVNFGEPPSSWARFLMEMALKGVRLEVAVRLAAASLFVVKLIRQRPAGPDCYQESRERLCCARAGFFEHHFYALPPGWRVEPAAVFQTGDLSWSVVGPEGRVPAPPTRDETTGEVWTWETPPWEQPPGYPGPRVLTFLEEQGILQRAVPAAAEIPSWDDAYAAVRHAEPVLQALLARPASPELYYQSLLTEAVRAGLSDLRLLAGLLWHAPHSDLPQRPELLPSLLRVAVQLVAREGGRTLPPAIAGPGPENAAADHEALKTQVQQLTSLTQAMERQLAALQQPEPLEGPRAGDSQPPWWQDWCALVPRTGLPPEKMAEFRDAVQALADAHPNLAADREKVQLLVYCYQNYIAINPHFAGLTYGEKLARAVAAARDFLKG
jgi:hypothetical protein